MVRPPEAEPVSAARMLVATASETSGPPSMPSTQSRTMREGRQRGDDGAEADQARDAERRQHDGIGAGIHALRATPAGAGQLRAAARRSQRPARPPPTRRRRPPTSEVPPQRGSARKDVSMRGRTTSDIRRLTAMTTTSGKRRQHDRRAVCAALAMMDLRRIEVAAPSSPARARADRRRRRPRAAGASSPKPSPRAPRRGLGALQPPQCRSPA